MSSKKSKPKPKPDPVKKGSSNAQINGSKKSKNQKRPKVQTENKSKQQRRKILEFRRMQSRFASHTNIVLDDVDDDNANDTIDEQSDVHDESKLVEEDGALFIELSEPQEDSINDLETALEAYDEDYFGYIEYDAFLSICKSHKINLSERTETFFLIALTLIDEGVDYYGFLRRLREAAATQPTHTLTQLCQQMAMDAEQRANDEHKQQQQQQEQQLDVTEVEVNEAELDQFYQAVQSVRSRGMSLATMNRTSTIIPQHNKIRQVMNQFVLDESEIDFAMLKTALAAIECHPNDDDLIFLINYLAQTSKESEEAEPTSEEQSASAAERMDNDEVFVDLNYLLSFCQEVSNVPVVQWTDPQRVIEMVARQTRTVYRTQQRQKQDKLKSRHRLAQRQKLKSEQQKHSAERKALDAEEKRLRALRLRDKAKTVSAPTKDEKSKLKEWIAKRGEQSSKKQQQQLEKWMQSNNVFHKWLFNAIVDEGIHSMSALKNMSTKKMDGVLYKIRIERMAQNKSQSERNKVDKALVAFEKKYRKLNNGKTKKTKKTKK